MDDVSSLLFPYAWACSFHEASTALPLVLFSFPAMLQQWSHGCHRILHHHSDYCTKWVQFWANYPFWHWIVDDNNTQCAADVGGEGERLNETAAGACQHCEVADCGCARVCTCRHCANSSPALLSGPPAVHGFDCECSLCQLAVSQNECLLEIKLSLFILVIPAGGRKGWAWPWALQPLQKKRRRKIRLFFFLLQSCREPPSSVAFRVQMRWTPSASQCRRCTPSNS